MSGVVYVNGRLVPSQEATVPAFDHGLLYGLAVFETMRVYEGRVFGLAMHLGRLERGAVELGFTPPSGLGEAVASVLRANGTVDGRVRLTVTAGAGQGGPGSAPETPPTVLATVSPFTPPTEQAYEAGHKAVITTVRRNSLSVVPRLKSNNLIENLLAARQAKEKDADQAFMLNEKRCFTECAWANLFFVAYGGLVTPGIECGLLPGITRDMVIGLALKMGLAVTERWINSEEVWDAEEVFVTSSILGVFPVTFINGRKVRGGVPGKVTRALTMAYNGMVKEELGLAAPPR